MKFRALPTSSFEDVTLDLEQLGVHGIFDDTTAGGDLTGKYPKPTLAIDRLRVPTFASPVRALNTVYQPSTTRPTLVLSTINLNNGAGQTSAVQMFSDASNPPVTEHTRVANQTGSSAVQMPLIALVSAGNFYKMTSSGAGASSVIETTEYTL